MGSQRIVIHLVISQSTVKPDVTLYRLYRTCKLRGTVELDYIGTATVGWFVMPNKSKQHLNIKMISG